MYAQILIVSLYRNPSRTSTSSTIPPIPIQLELDQLLPNFIQRIKTKKATSRKTAESADENIDGSTPDDETDIDTQQQDGG